MHEYINTDLNPIDIDSVPWLYERKEKICIVVMENGCYITKNNYLMKNCNKII
jgi:hypothetical protein